MNNSINTDRHISVPRGLGAILYMNIIYALPLLIGLQWRAVNEPQYHVLRLCLLFVVTLAQFVGGLQIAFGSDWLKLNFWSAGKNVVDELKRRLWTLLPFVLVGIGGSIFVKQPFVKDAFSLSSFAEVAANTLAQALVLIIFLGILRRRFGLERAAVFVAIGFAILAVFKMKWYDAEFVINNALILINSILFTIALSRMFKNSDGSIFLIMAYAGLQALLGDVFSIFEVSHGAVLQQLTILVSMLAIYWVEIGFRLPITSTPRVVDV